MRTWPAEIQTVSPSAKTKKLNTVWLAWASLVLGIGVTRTMTVSQFRKCVPTQKLNDHIELESQSNLPTVVRFSGTNHLLFTLTICTCIVHFFCQWIKDILLSRAHLRLLSQFLSFVIHSWVSSCKVAEHLGPRQTWAYCVRLFVSLTCRLLTDYEWAKNICLDQWNSPQKVLWMLQAHPLTHTHTHENTRTYTHAHTRTWTHSSDHSIHIWPYERLIDEGTAWIMVNFGVLDVVKSSATFQIYRVPRRSCNWNNYPQDNTTEERSP